MTVSPATLDCLFHQLYATAVREPDGEALWETLARGLATALDLPLVLVCRYEPHGTVNVLATSRESHLWSDLHRLPERWDGSVVGHGLAAMALESGGTATLKLDDERFVCWRAGAERDRLHSGAAVFVETALGRYLVELFATEPRAFDDTLPSQRMLEIRNQLQQFFADLQTLREQRLLSRALDGAGNAAFITDREGTIVWCNRAFTRLYGYTREEAVGQNPRFLKSGRQGVRYYRELWSTIRSGKVWAGETVDRDRSGVAYTVRQTITPFACDDHLSHFLAVHDDVSRENAQRFREQLRTGIDPITGLLTRAAFEARIAGAADDQHWSLLLISLRDFAQGVAALGADLAEGVASQIGTRIRDVLGSQGVAALLGPGEFVVQLPTNGVDRTDAVMRELTESLLRPYPQIDGPLVPRPRLAAARYPSDGTDFDSLIHHADRQLADRPVARARLN